MAKTKNRKLNRKLRRMTFWYIGTLVLAFVALFIGFYFLQRFNVGLGTSAGVIDVRMIPKGVKMATVVPEEETEISVSSSKPQIAWVYDEKHHITDLAIYLPRDGLRKNYIEGHEFPDGSEYTSGQLLKLSNGRYLYLDFSQELAMEAELWMQYNTDSEQGILITTRYSAVNLSESQARMCELVFELSRYCTNLKDATLAAAGFAALRLEVIIAMAASGLYAAIVLWYVHRYSGSKDENDDETSLAADGADADGLPADESEES